MFRAGIGVALICVTAGCASRTGTVAVKSADTTPVQSQKTGTTDSLEQSMNEARAKFEHSRARTKGTAATDSLEQFMREVRAKSERARPHTTYQETAEASDAALQQALARLKEHPSAAAHRAVAVEYMRLKIEDVAHEHYSAAIKLDTKDAASWDGRARIWRDWGFSNLALPDASRAVYYAPDSAIVHNTLGTVLQSLGRRSEARAEYEKALTADPSAAYALTNLCYGWALDGESARAVDACRQALRLKPDSEAARNNLALAHELGGDFPAALDVLNGSGDEARAAYNAGILHLARRRYPEALQSFQKALSIRPPYAAAELMARQTRNQMKEGTAR